MVESGATPEEIAQVLVQQQLLEAIGKSPEQMSKALLKHLRSGETISPEEILSILKSGGLDPESAAKAILVQKALTRCGEDCNDIARAILMQKALIESGNSTPSVIEAIKAIMADSGISMEQAAQEIVLAIGSGELNIEDIQNAIDFERFIDSGGVSVDGVRIDASKESVTDALKEMVASGKIKPDAMMKTAMLQKLMSSLEMKPEALAKLMQLQKCMYNSGASPQDIALIMQTAEQHGNANVSQDLMEILKSGLEGADIEMLSNLIDAVKGASLSPELTSKIIQLQAAIESKITTPEKSAALIASLMKDDSVDSLVLVDHFKKVLKENGITNETLEKSVLLQKLFQSSSISPKDLTTVLEMQNSLLKAGATPNQISKALENIISASGNCLSSIAKIMSTCLDQKRIKGDDIIVAGLLSDAIDDALSSTKSNSSKEILSEIKPGLSQDEVNNILKTILERNNISPESVAKVSLFQKLMTTSDCSPEDLAKALRIQNSMLKNGAPVEIISQTINDTLEPRNRNLIDRFKSMLGDVTDGKKFEVSDNVLDFMQKYQKGMKSNSQSAANMKEILESALHASGLSKDDMAKALMVQKAFVVSGVTPEALAQAIQFEKALSASGATPEEICCILAKVCDPHYSDNEISRLMSKVLQNRNITKQEIENITNLQQSLRAGGLANDPELQGLISSGQVDLEVLGKAVLMQKLLTSSGLSIDDLGKAALLQQALIDAGVPPEKVAECLQRTLMESGVSLEHLASLMEIELKSSSSLCPEDIKNILHFDKVLGGATAAKLISRKLNPEQQKLLVALVGGEGNIS
jgi:plasmid maintenance system antidote protein VapI